MRKIILAISLSTIMLLCGCGADKGSITVTTVPPASDIPPSASAGIVIPPETKVYAAAGELAGVKPLFESYILEDDLFAFAVSAVFKGEVYIMGFLYKNYEDTLPFSRVIGLKQNGTGIEEAFISDNYKPDPKGWEPENYYTYQEEQFCDTEAFETGGMLVVKTNEFLSEDAGFHNIFLINEEGLLDNHINFTLMEPCQLFEYNGKLLLNENYTWYDFTVKDKKIALNEITDFKPYMPKTDINDFIITLKDFTPDTFDKGSQDYKDDGKIKADIDGHDVLTKEDFNVEDDDFGCGPYYVYLSKEKFKIKAETRIILLYPPGMKVDCSISGEMDDGGFERSSLPGALVLKAQEPGEYTVQIENDGAYQIFINAE